MAALIAPLCVRYSVNGVAGEGSTWTNVWDFRITPNEGETRDDVISIHAAVLRNCYVSYVGPYWHTDAGIDNITWVDLDNAEGTTGALVLPARGSDTGDPCPANTSVLVRKIAPGGGRSSRNGRTYFAGFTDPVFESRAIDGGFRSSFQGDMNDFFSACSEYGTGTDFPLYSAFLTVIHTRNEGTPTDPNIVYVSNSPVTNLTVDGIAATQRRRLRRT